MKSSELRKSLNIPKSTFIYYLEKLNIKTKKSPDDKMNNIISKKDANKMIDYFRCKDLLKNFESKEYSENVEVFNKVIYITQTYYIIPSKMNYE